MMTLGLCPLFQFLIITPATLALNKKKNVNLQGIP
jgi:hypothetical protein